MTGSDYHERYYTYSSANAAFADATDTYPIDFYEEDVAYTATFEVVENNEEELFPIRIINPLLHGCHIKKPNNINPLYLSGLQNTPQHHIRVIRKDYKQKRRDRLNRGNV